MSKEDIMNIKKETISIILVFIFLTACSITINSYIFLTFYLVMSLIVYDWYRKNPTKENKNLFYLYCIIYFLVGIGLLLLNR